MKSFLEFDQLDEEAELDESKHYDQGSFAALKGKAYSDNPHPKGSKEHLDWAKGHNAMRAMKEETLDELSKDTLGSYIHKSFRQGNDLHQDLSHMRGDKATDAERKAVRDKISKRNLGVIKANKKLKEENQMISYSEFMAKLEESSASERAAEILAAKRAERLDKYDFSKEKQKPASAAKQVKGHSYGADKSDDEDDEDVKKSSEPEVKRGRGRPAGSKSGARV